MPAGPLRAWLPMLLVLMALTATLLAGCGEKAGGAPAASASAASGAGGGGAAGGGGGAPGAGMPPPQVGVVTTKTQAVPLEIELPGRIEALRTAQVRSRVTGIVERRLFTEGSDVKAGQVLYRIDAAPYRAAVDNAAATLARARATAAQAKAVADRYEPLAKANAISQQDYTNARATQQQAEADVAAATAALQSSRINLGYAQVTAPISGRIGRSLVTEGALVTQTEATPLTTIQQIGSVYVNFTQSATEVSQLRRAAAARRVQVADDKDLPVRIVLDDGTVLQQTGKLLFSDVAVDPTSGQITLRAEVANPGGLLLPGQYVRVRLSQAELPSAILVPQQAVTRSSQADTLTVIGDDNKPQRRSVKIAGAWHGQWIVTDGLQPGERVMADGFQKLMMAPPGSPVTPVPWQPPASAPPASAASAAAATPAASSAAAAAPGAASAASAASAAGAR